LEGTVKLPMPAKPAGANVTETAQFGVSVGERNGSRFSTIGFGKSTNASASLSDSVNLVIDHREAAYTSTTRSSNGVEATRDTSVRETGIGVSARVLLKGSNPNITIRGRIGETSINGNAATPNALVDATVSGKIELGSSTTLADF
jgi:hypothetical protein